MQSWSTIGINTPSLTSTCGRWHSAPFCIIEQISHICLEEQHHFIQYHTAAPVRFLGIFHPWYTGPNWFSHSEIFMNARYYFTLAVYLQFWQRLSRGVTRQGLHVLATLSDQPACATVVTLKWESWTYVGILLWGVWLYQVRQHQTQSNLCEGGILKAQSTCKPSNNKQFDNWSVNTNN